MIKGVYSIAIAVHDLDRAVVAYRDVLGVEPVYGSGYEAMLAGAGLRECGLDFDDQAAIFELQGTKIVLLTSTNPESAVGKVLEKRGQGVFKISFETDNAQKEFRRLRELQKELILNDEAVGGFGSVNFLHPKQMNSVLIEIIEPKGVFSS